MILDPFGEIAPEDRIFVNRALNFANIKMVGFDMDHTLAAYKHEFEALAFRETLKKFIEHGYPEELIQLKFKAEFLKRGLLVDRERGNLLKVDGHKYVKEAYHGHRQLTKDERHQLYNAQSYKAQEFLSVDTFFALSEVQLFVEIVEFVSKNPGRIKKNFTEIYADLRKFIDDSHADGSIKEKVIADPARYIEKDPELSSALVRLLDANKSLFLLTNSHYGYTEQVMSYILDGATDEYPAWRDYWDVIIVGASKPGFFVGNQAFYEVIPDTEYLKTHRGPLHPYSIYHGGNAKLFEQLTGYLGDEILYVGDHIFGDINRSKASLNWRTMLVVEELSQELPIIKSQGPVFKQIGDLLLEKEKIDHESMDLSSQLALLAKKARFPRPEDDGEALWKRKIKLEEKLEKVRVLQEQLSYKIKALIRKREADVHPIWGELMKVGLEKSRFAGQVLQHACLYSSRASNLRFYSPYKKFLSFHDTMPHDFNRQ